jgi:hypothetical protein
VVSLSSEYLEVNECTSKYSVQWRDGSAHFLLLNVPKGIRTDKSHKKFHPVSPAVSKPPYDHMAQAIDKKNIP